MSTIIGFDLSSRKLAAVVLRDDEQSTFTCAAPKKEKNRANILAQFTEELESFFSRTFTGKDDWVVGENYVFVEHPVVGRAGAHATIVQAQVQGVVLATSVLCGAGGAYPVNVQTWKKVVVGHGGSSKERVAEWLSAHHPVLSGLAGEDQDLVDASCVALYGRQVIERGEALSGA